MLYVYCIYHILPSSIKDRKIKQKQENLIYVKLLYAYILHFFNKKRKNLYLITNPVWFYTTRNVITTGVWFVLTYADD